MVAIRHCITTYCVRASDACLLPSGLSSESGDRLSLASLGIDLSQARTLTVGAGVSPAQPSRYGWCVGRVADYTAGRGISPRPEGPMSPVCTPQIGRWSRGVGEDLTGEECPDLSWRRMQYAPTRYTSDERYTPSSTAYTSRTAHSHRKTQNPSNETRPPVPGRPWPCSRIRGGGNGMN